MRFEITKVEKDDFLHVKRFADMQRELEKWISFYPGDISIKPYYKTKALKNALKEMVSDMTYKGYTYAYSPEFIIKSSSITYNMLNRILYKEPNISFFDLIVKLNYYTGNRAGLAATYTHMKNMFKEFPDGIYIYNPQYKTVEGLMIIKLVS